MNRHRAFVAARWLLAGALGAWTARQMFLAGTTDNEATGLLRGFFGIAGILATVLLLAPDLVGWILTPINGVIDSILLPCERGTPPADYTLARFYVQQLRYDEAVEEYLKIIHYHPRELPAYLEGMMTAGQAQQVALIEKFHRLGRRAFRGAKTRERLQTVWENSRLTATTLAGVADEDPAGSPEDLALETGESPPSAPPSGQLES